MEEHKDLTAGRASYIYLITIVLLLVGSWVSSIVFGFGWSLWVNQGVFLAIAASLAWKNKWSWREVYRFRGTDFGTAMAALVTGFGLWWGGLAFNIWSERLVIRLFGVQPDIGLELSALDPFLIIFALVILAPICEEILFRGYFLRAFEAQTLKPWVWSGIFFGVIHIGNGLASTIPAIIYGFVFGYIVWRSGSILAGIMAHMGVNINAVLLGGVFQEFIHAPGFSPSLLIMSLLGLAVLALGIWWFRRRQVNKPVPPGPEKPSLKLRPLQWGALALTCLILLGLGTMDAYSRITNPEIDSGYSSFTAGSFTGHMQFAEIEVTHAPVTLQLTFDLSSDVIDAVLVVLDPHGTIVWSEEIVAQRITINRFVPVEITLDREGIWIISLNGSGEGTKFDAYWKVIRW